MDDIAATVADLEDKGVEFVDYAEGPLATTNHIAQLAAAQETTLVSAHYGETVLGPYATGMTSPSSSSTPCPSSAWP